MATAASLIPSLTFKSWTATGVPNAFGTLQSYQAGTSTPLATWTDWTAVTPNLNPLSLNARGEANVYLLPNVGYKFVESDQFGNVIKTTDQVFNSQLLTLFGGVDTGTANNYLLTFTANFSAYANGIVIYFIAANTNTGASTLNVNGLGVVAIVNSNGQPLNAGQIIAGQVAAVMYYNGNWLLISSPLGIPTQGSFTANFTGTTGIGAVTASYVLNGSLVSLTIPYANGVSNATTFTITGLPVALQPASRKLVFCGVMQDNGVLVSGLAQFDPSSGTITLWKTAAGAGNDWTASGAKGVGYQTGGLVRYAISITYPLT